MNYKLLMRTVSHLRMTQVVNQVLYRVHKAKYVQSEAPTHRMLQLVTEPIPRYHGVSGEDFTFLNLTHKFTDWNFVGNGTLFTYNQNYFDFINDGEVGAEESCSWIDKWIADRSNITWGLDPYPIALRGINWIKFFCRYPECATKEREDSLWSQYKLLEKKLEYHLLGNHLLEDAYSLYIGACYFDNIQMKAKAEKILLEQLREQTLEDGAHYEQSTMYHCILLDRLLDCINVGLGARVKGQENASGSRLSTLDELKAIAKKQLGWLATICYEDGSLPMFNDADLGIAPTPDKIFDYAKRLGLSWEKTELKESGYRKLTSGKLELIADVGNITATYQPGHTHADTTNYQLHIDGKPVVVDTGISTYDKTPRRQYERSTAAHNCVCTLNGSNGSTLPSSYEVWGGFRVGKRCKTTILKDTPDELIAEHDGYGNPCRRRWTMGEGNVTVEDTFAGNAISYIHLAEGVNPERLIIEGADKVEILDTKYSVEYNKFIRNKTIAIHFKNRVKYTIS